MNLVEACLERGFEAFVHAGSSSEYGRKDHAPPEDESLDPNSEYAVTKASATMYCRHTAIHRNVPITTLRLYSVYGPYEEPTRLFPTLVTMGLKGRLPPLASPDTARDYIHVDDVADAFIRVAETKQDGYGTVYNLGTGTQTTLAQIVALTREMLDIDEVPVWNSMPDRQWDTSTWFANIARIRAALGWEPRRSIREGLQGLIEWFVQNPAWQSFYDSARKSRSG